MKKLLFLAAALVMGVGAWAQGTSTNEGCVTALPAEASAQSYVLSAPRGTLLGTESDYLQSTCLPANESANPFDKTAEQFQFLLFPVEGQANGFYIYNVGTDKFLGARTTANTDGSHTAGVAPMTADAPAVYYIWKHGQTGSTGDGYGRFNFNKQDWPWTIGSQVRVSGNYNTINMTYWNNGVGYDFGGTSGIDGGNAYAVVPAEMISKEIYNEAYHTAYGEYPAGPTPEQIQALQEKIDAVKATFGKVGYPKVTPDETVTEENYSEALAAYNAYLNSDDVNMPEDNKAYNLILCDPNGGKYYLYRNSEGQLATSTTEPVGNTAKFVVSNVDGGNMTFAVEGEYVQWFCTESNKCYNGNTKGLSATTNAATTLTVEKATATNYGSGNIEGATAEGLLGKVQIKGPGKTGTWYYNFRTDGAFISQYAGDKFYDDNWDDGRSGLWRTCFFELVETELIVKNAWTDLEETLAVADEYSVGENYGQYTLEEGDWAATIEAAQAELAEHTTEANAEQLNTTITDYIAALTLNVPAHGTFLTIQNNRGQYIDGASTTGTYRRGETPSVMYYDEEGHLIGYPGGYTLDNGEAAALASTTATYEFVKGSVKGALAIQNNDSKYLMDWTDGRFDVFETIESTCNFTVGDIATLPVLFEVAENGYTTLYSPVALNIPDGVEVYAAAFNEEKSNLKAEAIKNVIPAATAVVLHHTAELAEDATVDFEIATLVAVDEMANELQGSFATVAADENSFVFALQEGNAGFYRSGASLAGFKAYYAPETPVDPETPGFALDFSSVGPTGISQLSALNSHLSALSSQLSALYDLSGRRVRQATRGLYIQSDRKVMK